MSTNSTRAAFWSLIDKRIWVKIGQVTGGGETVEVRGKEGEREITDTLM